MTKRCEICQSRPIMSATAKRRHGVDFPYCEPCMVLANWENSHSDYGHEDITSGTIEYGQTNHATRDLFDAWVQEQTKQCKICWVCHPELDTTSAEYTPRKGVDRTGQIMHTSLRAHPLVKAAEIKAQLPPGTKVLASGRTSKQDGSVTLRVRGNGLTVSIVWDAQGRHFYPRSIAVPLGGGKPRLIRNASEALRLLDVHHGVQRNAIGTYIGCECPECTARISQIEADNFGMDIKGV